MTSLKHGIRKTLSSLPIGKTAEVFAVMTPPKVTLRLASLGLLPGSHVSMLRGCSNTFIIEYKGTFLALSRELAQQVFLVSEEKAS